MKLSLLVIFISLGLFSCTTQPVQKKEYTVKVTKSGEAKTWVQKPDGSRQCEPNSAVLTQEQAVSELRKGGVIVYQSREGHDGLMHTANCGSATGNTVEIEIALVDVEKAQGLGYRAPKASK